MADDRFVNHPPREFNQEVGFSMPENLTSDGGRVEQSGTSDSSKMEMGITIPTLMPTLDQSFRGEAKQPQDNFFKTGKTDERGTTHFQLTNEGKNATQRLFETLQGNTHQYSADEKARLINQINFNHLGFNDQQNETVRRSLRAQLIVTEARKLNPNANPWETVHEMKQNQLAENESETSAFQALDRALEQQTAEQEKLLVKLIGVEKARMIRGKWDRFTGKVLLRDVPSHKKKELALRIAIRGGTTVLTVLALNWVYTQWVLSQKGGISADMVSPQSPIATPINTPTDTLPTPVWQPTPIVEKPTSTFIPTPLPTETPAPTEIAYREVPFQEGQTYTFTLPTSSFAVEMGDIDDFNHPEADQKYMVATWFGLPGITTRQPGGVSEETTINVHADYYQGEKLPGTQLVDAVNSGELNPGDIVSVENQDGSVASLEFLGASSELDRGLFGETGAEEHRMAIDAVTILGDNPPAREAREDGRNIVAILTCTPGTRNSEGLYDQKTVLAFTPVQ